MAVGKGFAVASKAVEEQQKNNANVEYPKFTLKVEEGMKRVRFLNPEDVITFIEHWTTFKNTWKRNFVCVNEGIPGVDKCHICRGKKGEDYVEDQRKHAHMINVINRATGAVEVWKFSPMVMSSLLQKNEEYGNISDRDFNVQFMENTDENIKAKFVYVIQPASEEPEPLSAADKALKPFDLEALVPKYDEENLLRIAAMEPGDNGKKGGLKPASTASDFAAALGRKDGKANAKSLLDDFAGLAKAKPATASVETPASEEAPATTGSANMDEFNRLLNDM